MDQFNLQRFLEAQDGPMFGWVIEELTAGQKKGHWMWFIFPQAYGLGESHHSQFYGIKSLEEAAAYWTHPVLGERLRQCLGLIINCGRSALEIFGKEVDVMKLQSCLTLFLQIDLKSHLLQNALNQFFARQLDEKTMKIILEASKR
jgi:uncharacterized protein (DUF1810 family)